MSLTKLVMFSILLNSISFSESLSISSKIYFDYTHFPESTEGFSVKRAYFTFKKKVSSDLSFTLQTDVNYKSEPKYIYLKKANVSWENQLGRWSIGVIGMNIFDVQEKTWGNRFIEKSSMDHNKYSSSADLGIGYNRNLSQSISLSTLLTNGGGYKYSENDKYKKLSIQMVLGEKNLIKNNGFNYGGAFSFEPFHKDSSTSVIGLFAGYSSDDFRGGLEYNQIKVDESSSIISGYVTWKYSNKASLFGRIDSYNNRENSDPYLLLGLIYNPAKGLNIAPNYRMNHKDFDDSLLMINILFNF
tara:strand:+ start:517 stop:1419 length:903 start_codon:yes stop_codon:yes gene_type:complete